MQAQEVEAELKRIQDMIVARRYDAALEALSAFHERVPDNNEALYMVAVCHRYRGDYAQALASLEGLKQRVPEHGRAHQEEGHSLRRLGRAEEALRAFARATHCNPALVASWRAQHELLDQLGRPQQAAAVRRELDRVQSLPKALLAVMDLISQGRLLKAEDLCRAFLRQQPKHVEAMRLLAEIATRFGVLDDAEVLLRHAVEFAPEDNRLRVDYVQVLRRRQRFDEALEQTQLLLEREPDNPRYRSLHAVECMQTGDFDAALDHFDRVLDRVPNDPATLTSRGHALKTAGRYQDAVGSYRAALDAVPQHGEAYYSLANLKVYRFEDAELGAMRTQENNVNLSQMDRVYLSFALGKAYEDREDYAQAFHYYARGNALKKAQSRYDAEQIHEDLQAQQRVCSRELFDAHAGAGCPAPDPIFIVGLPRAGSTLIEQILSSHSQVDGTMELPHILSLSHRLRRARREGKGSGYPDVLAELDAEELRHHGEQFIADTRIHRQGAPFFTDKMPNNFRHIGLIRLILPNAKIIDARRHPMSCCFSAFKQLFAEGQEFSYSLDDLGRYYRDYVALMDHWDAVLPGFVLRVQHEDVVADLEGQVRRLLDFCGLPFEEACLRYHETERSVRTPSSEQVRQPIFTSALEQWRHFEGYLQPLVDALGPDLLARYPIEARTRAAADA
jgi:tetratricopeptide (TPR) repeat protein